MFQKGTSGRIRAFVARHPRWTLLRTGLQMLDMFLYSSAAKRDSAPFVKDRSCVQQIHSHFIIASVPCWLIGVWNAGHQANLALQALALGQLPGWRGAILDGIGIGFQPDSILACFALGLLYFVPLFLLVLAVAGFWGALFAAHRKRPPDAGLLLFAWLFTLLLPPAAPLLPVALGVSFGTVIGKHIFGGNGFYLISPVVVGMVFLWLAYPDLVFAASSWVPVPGAEQLGINPGVLASTSAVEGTTQSAWSVFLGARPGAMGTTSLLGTVLGALYLLGTASASWRIVAGALLGIAVMLPLFGAAGSEKDWVIAVSLQLSAGGLLFVAVFVATDPFAAGMTNTGRWGYGVIVGVLALLLRQTNPTVGDSVLFALFIASLLVPLIDAAVITRNKSRRQRKTEGTLNG